MSLGDGPFTASRSYYCQACVPSIWTPVLCIVGIKHALDPDPCVGCRKEEGQHALSLLSQACMPSIDCMPSVNRMTRLPALNQLDPDPFAGCRDEEGKPALQAWIEVFRNSRPQFHKMAMEDEDVPEEERQVLSIMC